MQVTFAWNSDKTQKNLFSILPNIEIGQLLILLALGGGGGGNGVIKITFFKTAITQKIYPITPPKTPM